MGGPNSSLDDDILYPNYLKIIYNIYIKIGLYGVHSTTETGLPLFTNADLEFVFNLNID